jgi:hypothetical protein
MMKGEEEEICQYIWMSEEDWKKINPFSSYPQQRMEKSKKLSKEEYQKWFKKFEDKEEINQFVFQENQDGKDFIVESIKKMMLNKHVSYKNNVKTVFQNAMKLEKNEIVKQDYQDAIKEVFGE